MRHAISLVFALCISIIGGTAFVYMIHAHRGAWRWMYTSAAMLFLTGVMVAYDELFVPSITCPKCRHTSYHPKDIAERYCQNSPLKGGKIGRRYGVKFAGRLTLGGGDWFDDWVVGHQFVPDYLHHPVSRYRTPRVIRGFVP